MEAEKGDGAGAAEAGPADWARAAGNGGGGGAAGTAVWIAAGAACTYWLGASGKGHGMPTALG